MFRLKPLGDVTCFLKEDFRNEVVIITTGNAFKCNGMLLAARSSLITRMLSNKEISRPIVIPHSVPQIDVCLRLVYGGCVIVDWNNYTSIFIFGLFLQMVEFVLGVFRWVSNQTSDTIFWSVFFDLTTLGLDASMVPFQKAAERYISNDYDDFLTSARLICKNCSTKTLKDILELIEGCENVFHDESIFYCKIFEFLVDLFNDIDDNEQGQPQLLNSCTKDIHTDTLVSLAIRYLQMHTKWVKHVTLDVLCHTKYIQLLNGIAAHCYHLDRLNIIVKISGAAGTHGLSTNRRELAFSSTHDLSRELIKTLSAPSTSFYTICDFIQEAANVIHQCVIGEIVIHWWISRIRPEYTNNIIKVVVKALFTLIRYSYSGWLGVLAADTRYADMIDNLRILSPTPNYIYCYFDCKNLSRLKACIEKGDGMPLRLSPNDLRSSRNMDLYKHKLTPFRYNPGIAPTYGCIEEHWFLVCYIDTTEKFMSFVTDTQQDIISHLDSSYYALLFFVPSINS